MSKFDLDEIRKLSPEARLELIDEIWDTLDEDDLGPLTDEQCAMLDERLEAHRRDPGSSIPWEVARARLEALE